MAGSCTARTASPASSATSRSRSTGRCAAAAGPATSRGTPTAPGWGRRGHVEPYASGAGLAKLARALVESGGSPFLAERARELGDPIHLSAKDVADGGRARGPGRAGAVGRARGGV